MRLSIDGTVCDLEAGTAFDPGYDAERMRSPEINKAVAVDLLYNRSRLNPLTSTSES